MVVLATVATVFTVAGGLHAEQPDLGIVLMRSTFKLEGINRKGRPVFGTVFAIGKPTAGHKQQFTCALVSAAHVFEQISADTATLVLRAPHGVGFKRMPLAVRVRQNGRPLWVRHEEVDVAAMLVELPREVDLCMVSTEVLATDRLLQEYQIKPGDELCVLGFPYGLESNDAGFPILRSGRIANYPITPTAVTRTFLLDFPALEGNSGGPVFLSAENRIVRGRTRPGLTQLVMGLVLQEVQAEDTVRGVSHSLRLGNVVHAGFIRDLLDRLR